VNTEAVVAILAALGGGGFLIQLVTFIRSWREGVQMRADAADERHVRRLEKRNAQLERRVDEDAAYQALLMTAIAQLGGTIPPRPKPRTTDPEGDTPS
jgi:hypothetical protein